MTETKYYSNNRLLTMKDKNGKLPDIYISDGNRTAGKSFAWKKHLVSNYFKGLKNGDPINQFMLIYRNKCDLKDSETAFFSDIQTELYRDHEMTSRKVREGVALELLLDDVPCGYAVPLSMARKIKQMSSMFIYVKHMLYDEYQDDDGKYLQDEVGKLMSIHTSVARGHGHQSRRVPLYMASNTVSMLNPYYSALGITKQLKSDTKFIRGDGWVYERTFNANAKNSFQASAFNRAFSNNNYFKHASENVYLNDNTSLIEKPTGNNRYILTVKYNGEWFCFRQYDCGIMYVDEGCDHTFPFRICFNVNDMTDDRALMITRGDGTISILREWFNKGRMRFKNLQAKNMAFDLLSYL